MTQNRSSAVMQQRREPHDSLDDFPTPPWAGRALCEAICAPIDEMTCREPTANRGALVRGLSGYFGEVQASDIHDYGVGFRVGDYLFGPPPALVDWTITNPPFRLAEQFIARALETSRDGVAMLVRTSFLEGVGRYDRLWGCHPPSQVLQFAERVIMHKGKLVNPDVPVRTWDAKRGEWVWRKPSTATSYCWLIWRAGHDIYPPEFGWIPPCRRRLTRAGDYVLPEALAA